MVNPYRGLASATTTTDPTHVTRALAQHAHRYGSAIWMDPGAPEVRAHVLAVLRDVLSRYDVDGLHFDDYFYPYPDATQTPFPDDASFAAYRESGGTLARDDWRRENVHALVRETAELVAAVRPDVRFGISPFGIHRPGTPEGIRGLDAYASLYCDAPRWLAEGWVDYLAPQLYWPTTQSAQDFDVLLAWWSSLATGGRSIFAGINLVQLGQSDAWTVDEYRAELRAVATTEGARGAVAYTARPLLENRAAIRDVVRDELWSSPALTPPLASADLDRRPEPPALRRDGEHVALSHPRRDALRAFVVYRGDAIAEVLPARAERVAFASDLAITAVDRRGVESLAKRAPAPTE